MIHTSETGTDKIPNASVTAGSLSSDLNRMAIINACDIYSIGEIGTNKD